MSYGFKDGKNAVQVYDVSEFSGAVNLVVDPKLALKQNQHGTAQITIPANGWTEIQGGQVVNVDTQSVSCSIVTASNTVFVSAAPASADEYGLCGILCIGQGNGSLTFKYKFAPTNDLTVNVVTLGV